MRIIAFLFIALLVQGCASTQGIVSQAVAPESKILVVSRMNPMFNFQVTGRTAFQNKMLTADVSDWQLNAYIEERVINKIQGFYNPASDPDISSQLSIPSDNYVTGYSNSMTNENGLDLLKESGFNYVLFITPIEFQDAFFQTNQLIEGYGIYKRGFMGRETSIVYSQISFTLFDVATGKFLASNGDTSSNGGNSVWVTHQYTNLALKINNSEQLETIVDDYKDDIFKLTNKLVDSSLKYMGFRLEES